MFAPAKSCIALLLLCLGMLVGSPRYAWGTSARNLPPTYAHWLNEEVPYLITNSERQSFLGLSTNADRDQFIENFWRVRNPDPNSPVNTAKEEHYRRLAYANDHFGARDRHDGWRTDQGMVYITLGAPQQKIPYHASQYMVPIELWFYQSPSPNGALPPYFSVLFYQRTSIEDFKIYSPYIDKPERLIQSTNAVNDEATAIKIIKQDLGSEVAHNALTMLPNEPIDTDSFQPSLESDALINRIRNYRNLPENIDLLNQRRAALEGVTHRVLLGEQFSDLSLFATRDSDDVASVHYLFRLLHPEDFAVTQQPDGRYFYSVSVESELLDAAGQRIYSDSQDLQSYVPARDVDQLRHDCFGIAGRLPVAPGQYQLHIVVTNKTTKQSFSQTRPLSVPGFDVPLSLSQVVFLAPAKPTPDSTLHGPFSFSGVQLAPLGGNNASLSLASPVRVLLQLWAPPKPPSSTDPESMNVTYTIGQLGNPAKHSTDQEVDRSSFDANGNLLLGKDLPTADLHAGTYRLVVQVTDPTTSQSTAQALNFTLVPPPSPALWTIDSPSYDGAQSAINAYRRGLCALNQKNGSLAARYLQTALAQGFDPRPTYTALAAAYRATGDTEAAKSAEGRENAAGAAPGAIPPKQN